MQLQHIAGLVPSGDVHVGLARGTYQFLLAVKIQPEKWSYGTVARSFGSNKQTQSPEMEKSQMLNVRKWFLLLNRHLRGRCFLSS